MIPQLRVLFAILLVWIPLVGLASEGPADWPHWSGPDFDLTSNAEGGFEGDFRLDLQRRIPLGSGYSGLVAADGRVVTAFSDGESDFIAAFEVASGEESWRYRIGRTYEGHDQSDDGPLSTPTIHEGKVLALGPWGDLLALSLEEGERIWSRHVVEELGAKEPFAGFATAPTVIGGVLVVQTGGPEGHSVSGLDPATGELLWSVEDDFVMYQSPVAVRMGEEDWIFAMTNERILGLRPRDGELLWELEHKLSEDQWHGITQPVRVDESSVLLNGMVETALFRVNRNGEGFHVTEVWRTRNLGRSYSPPVPFQGYVYGYSGSFLNCVDAETGERVWRSRAPGAGNLILVEGHLVILTSQGDVVVGEASPEGFQEKGRVRALDYGHHSRPSFASGRVFVRNLHELAFVGTAPASDLSSQAEPELRGLLGDFVRKLRTADDKSRLIDEFLAAHPEMPILDENLVHFVFRGAVEDLGLGSDFSPVEMPMHRVEGTDFYYRSVALDPGARYEYYYSVFGEIRLDPLNPHRFDIGGQEVSVVATLGWRESPFLEKAEGPRGRLEVLVWKSELLGTEREVQVYLPAGYDESQNRLPLLVVHGGDEALARGSMKNTLDHVVGQSVAPLIVAFVPQADWNESLSGIAEYSRASMKSSWPCSTRRSARSLEPALGA